MRRALRHFRGFSIASAIEEQGDEDELTVLRERVAPFILRRVKESVASELPPKTELGRAVELSADQRDLYESIRAAAHGEVRNAIKKRGFAASSVAILDALMKLRQVCCDPRLVSVEAAGKVEQSAKLDLFMDLLTGQLGQGRRVLVFPLPSGGDLRQHSSGGACLGRRFDETGTTIELRALAEFIAAWRKQIGVSE